jgi:pilus assembly protein CpaB
VDEVIGVAGFVLPGTRVDVLVTVEDQSAETSVSVTKLVLQNVQVLAAGESIQKDAEGKPQKVTVITLLVNPEDAERLTLAATEGRIQLALRNFLDQDSVVTAGSDIGSLISGRPEPVAPPVKKAATAPTRAGTPRSALNVELYRGVEKEVETF